MSLSAKFNTNTKFGEYVIRLQTGKNPLEHRCTLPTKKDAKKKERSGKRLYEYLVLLPYDHHVTKIYYDSFDSVDHARKEHVKSYPYILHPFSRLKVFFDILVALPYLVVQFYFPSFSAFEFPMKTESRIIVLTFGSIFILLNFITGYCNRKKGIIILKPGKILIHYIVTYFIVDLAMILPNILALIKIEQSPIYMYFMDIMFLSPFLRSFTFFEKVEDNLLTFSVSKKIINRVILAFKISLLILLCACVTSYVKFISGFFDEVFSSSDWRDYIKVYINEILSEVSRLYYTGFVAKTDQLVVTITTMIMLAIGGVGFAYFLAAMLMELSAGVAQESKYNQLSAEVKNFARQEHRDPAVRKRIIQMFDAVYLGTLLKEQRVKLSVPDNIRREINAETIGALLRKTKFISNLDEYLLLRMLEKLRLMVLLPKDHLVAEGQISDGMYFLSTGRLIMYSESTEIGHLDDGDHYAEESLFSEDFVFQETVIAATACYVYKLLRTDYLSSF